MPIILDKHYLNVFKCRLRDVLVVIMDNPCVSEVFRSIMYAITIAQVSIYRIEMLNRVPTMNYI